MALRTITYNVTADNISPRAVQNAGVQGEHNATEVIYVISEELLSSLAKMGGDTLFRVQSTDGAGGYHSSEFLTFDATLRKIIFPLGEELTSPGGICNLHLVISKISNGSEEETIYSFPAKIRFTHSNHEGEIEDARRASGLLKRALEAEETSVRSAESAKLSEEIAIESAASAKDYAEETKSYAKKAEMSVASVLACEEATEEAAAAADEAKEAKNAAIIAAHNANSAAEFIGENLDNVAELTKNGLKEDENFTLLLAEDTKEKVMSDGSFIDEVAEKTEENLKSGDAFIDQLKEQNNHQNFKIWVGTVEEYEEKKESLVNTLCIFTNEAYLPDIVKSLSDSVAALANDVSSKLPLSGGTITGQLRVNGILLTEGVDYGDDLPDTGVEGQLFFKKV